MGDGKGRVKGAWMVDSIKSYQAIAPDARARLVEAFTALPPAIRPGFDERADTFGVLPSSWYAEEMMHAAIEAMTRDLDDKGRDELALKLARAAAGNTLRGIYRVFFRLLATPQRFCDHAERLWTQSHDTGTLSAKLVGPRVVETRIDDWRGHHPFVCRVSSYIGVEIFSAMGLKGVKCNVQCLSDVGGRVCITHTTWER
jgi:hypothetical protein